MNKPYPLVRGFILLGVVFLKDRAGICDLGNYVYRKTTKKLENRGDLCITS